MLCSFTYQSWVDKRSDRLSCVLGMRGFPNDRAVQCSVVAAFRSIYQPTWLVGLSEEAQLSLAVEPFAFSDAQGVEA